jgi:hypothetical protein
MIIPNCAPQYRERSCDYDVPVFSLLNLLRLGTDTDFVVNTQASSLDDSTCIIGADNPVTKFGGDDLQCLSFRFREVEVNA